MKLPIQLLVLLALPQCLWAQSAARVQPISSEEQVIYKHVDASGRVTYANSPIKGGSRVILDTLTVIPSTPSGSLRTPEDQVVLDLSPAVKPLGKANAKASPSAPPVAKAPHPGLPQVATVTTMPSLKAATPTPSAPPLQSVSSPAPSAMEALAQKRREEVRRRVLQSEIETEEQMLSEARAQLAAEQKQTSSIRAMRASLVNTSADASKSANTAETKALVERHFERVRDLQDQISRHERSAEELRQQLQSDASRVAKGT